MNPLKWLNGFKCTHQNQSSNTLYFDYVSTTNECIDLPYIATICQDMYEKSMSLGIVTLSREKTMKAAVTVKENYEFRRIYRKGRSAVSPYFVVYCLKNRAGASRLGVTVSKKLGHAVVRNRVRRRIREIYRLNRDKMRPGWDVIVVGRGRSAAGPYRKMNEAYLDCLRRLSLLQEEGEA